MNGTPSFADPANLEPKRDEAIEVAPDGTSLDLLRAIYRRADLPLSTRMRAATAALPHEHPKLAVTTVVNAGDFADQLERAVERSRMVEAKPFIETKPPTNVTANPSTDTPRRSLSNGKPTIIDRRYR
ncbi:MAG: hypothetical protein WCF38_14905, partial [Pseudolabrys sp.]